MSIKQKVKLAALGGCASFCLIAGAAQAGYDEAAGGWTEVIGCPSSSFTNQWGHASTEWGGAATTVSKDPGVGWNTYAQTGEPSVDCSSWANGSVSGGATYHPGQTSFAQGVNVAINNFWYDFDFPSSWTQESQCGHQHTSMYVWGWRYNGSSWSFEFVEANQTATYWNQSKNSCEQIADGHPDFPPPFNGWAFGNKTITVNNSPYVVLYTKSQATSHVVGAGCGVFGCFHRMLTMVHYP